MAKSDKVVLVTGGSGFIGRHLVENLRQRYRVLAPSHAELDLENDDAVAAYFAKQKIDVAVHGAHREPNAGEPSGVMVEANLKMFFNLTRHVEKLERIVVLGSGAIYDKRRPLEKVKETALGERVPADPYGFTKYVIAQHVERCDRLVSLNLFGVYGPGESYLDKFIANASAKNIIGEGIAIHRNVVFDYLYIADLNSVVEHFIAHRPRWKNYNVAPDDAIDLVTIVRIINEISPKPTPVTVLNPGFKNEYTASNDRLRQELPKLRFTPYRDGIAQLYAHLWKSRERLDAATIRRDEYLQRVQQHHA